MVSLFKTSACIGMFVSSIHRNTLNKGIQIDVRENEFCNYLSPRKINFWFFDYYEYFVEWKTTPHPPVYRYWNLSLEPIKFIKKNEDITKNIRMIGGQIF